MKKTFFMLGCCAILAGCDNSSGRTDGYDKAYNNEAVAEDEKGIAAEPSAAGSNAATMPPEADAGTTETPEADAGITTETPEAAAGTTSGSKAAAAQGGNFEKGESLIASSDCLSCHQIDKKLVGPAYIDVAKKYEATAKNIDYLSTKIIQGGAGVWGQIPMTPHPDLSKENATEMVKYILSLNK